MTDGLNIRRAEANDVLALCRLAALDSQRPPKGPMLVAAIHGELRAAVPLRGGPAIADPFQRTAELVALLELRAAQLRGLASASRRPRYASLLPRRRRAIAQGAS